jgi:hypothetical protein
MKKVMLLFCSCEPAIQLRASRTNTKPKEKLIFFMVVLLWILGSRRMPALFTSTAGRMIYITSAVFGKIVEMKVRN